MELFYQIVRAAGAVGFTVALYYAIKFQLQLRAISRERREMKLAIRRIVNQEWEE